MYNKINKTTAVFLLASITLSMFDLVPINSVGADGSTIMVPNDYQTIQEAIDNAVAGDTIIVSNGTYPETILIDKSLSIHGQDKSNTLIDAMGDWYSAIKIIADNVTLSGFTVQNSTYHGIEVLRFCLF